MFCKRLMKQPKAKMENLSMTLQLKMVIPEQRENGYKV